MRIAWEAAKKEETEVASKTYEWDSEGRLTFNSDQKFSFDAEGRVAVCEYIYPDYNIRTTYEYDETGHCIKRTADLVYAGGTVTPSDVQDITWTESDGVVTTETVSHYYNESTATWSTTGKLVEETFDEPAGGWTKNTVYTLGPDGKTFVIDSRSHETIKRIVPGMINGYVTSSREERRYGDKLCLINESSTNVWTDLGNYTVRIETTGMRYEYRSDGSLYREEPVKHEYTLQAYEYLPGLWAQNILYTKEYKYDSGTNEMILSREINREYNAQNLMILYEDAEYFWDFVDRTRTVFYRDELGREYERVQNNGHNDEIHPFLRHRITYVGDSYAYNTFEYSYYDKEADDWRVPSELYEYEWDTSVDGDKCYCFGATPAGLSVMAYKPVSRKLTKTASDGTATVEIERYYFNTSEELGGVESVTADRSAAGPVTVYSLSGANLGVYGSLEEAAIPAGLYIARQGTVVSKVVRR